MYYGQKLVLSGDFLELYKYDTIQNRGYKKQKIPLPLDSDEKSESEKKQEKKERTMFSINRTRTLIRRIINSNKDLEKFVTLTFKENLKDIQQANRIFSKFIMRLKYKYPELKYLAVIEFQKRGAVHYHFLSNLPYVSNNILSEIWGNGFVKINEIKHVDNIGAYVCKYLQKDVFDERMSGQKKYFCSKNCIKPTEIFDEYMIKTLCSQYGLSYYDPVYKCEFDNQYKGHVQYSQYKLNITNPPS